MADPVRFVLLADGTSDSALLSVIRWTVAAAVPKVSIDAPGFVRRTGPDLAGEMRASIREHRPDVLFVHRDAERERWEVRWREIPDVDHCVVRVVPVRMTEAWFLFDEAAIRAAAGRPNGRADLGIPGGDHETLPDPKKTLHDALLAASEARGRRRKQLLADLPSRVRRVSELIDDWSPLRNVAQSWPLSASREPGFRPLSPRRPALTSSDLLSTKP